MASGERVQSPPAFRSARPEARFDTYSALATAGVAAAAYVGALFLPGSLPQGLAASLFAVAPVLGAVAAVVLWSRGRATADPSLIWVSSGVAVAVTGMGLQLMGLPFVAENGGPLGTSGDSSAALYLGFHLALAGGVAAAALGCPAGWWPWAVGGSALLLVWVATDLVPLPTLLTARQTFTGLLVGAEIVLAVVIAGALLLWVRRIGRSARSLHGWVVVALSLSVYDVLLNAVAARRFDPVWWASLSLRVATYAVLAAGAVYTVLGELRRLESFTEDELDRAELEVGRSWTAKEHLLRSATRLSTAVSPHEVARAVVTSCVEATGLPRASILALDPEARTLRLLDAVGYDAHVRRQLAELAIADDLPGPEALRTGQPVIVSSAKALHEAYPQVRTRFGDLDSGAEGAFPLTVGTETVGLLMVAGPETREWSESDHAVVAALAAQAAQALQRAVLFERQRTTAEVLQRGLLPRTLPRRSDFQVAGRYVPGEAGMQVGGDWYDCIETADGRVALVVGDVMGKGRDAASLMGEMRHALRAFVIIDPAPAAVLGGLDRLAEDLGDDVIVTVVYVLVDPRSGEAVMGRAGHMPPLLVGAAGESARFLEDGGSPPLGVPVAVREEARFRVPDGALLLLFSDGLVEDRRSALDEGMPSLRDACPALAAAHARDLDAFADAVLAFGGGTDERFDDVTLLALRLPGRDGVDERAIDLPASADSVPRARRFVRQAGAEWGGTPGGDPLDTLELLTSEVVTNAVLHGRTAVRLRLLRRAGRVRVEVSDEDPTSTVRVREDSALGTGGRGMRLVEMLAVDWDVDVGAGRKTVWFEVDDGSVQRAAPGDLAS